MFVLDHKTIKLNFWFQGYEAPEHRYNGDDDSWAGFHAEVKTQKFEFESHSTDIESASIDYLKKLLEDFLNNKMDKVMYYSPVEEGFSIRFYPKGTDYGFLKHYDKNKKLIEDKEVELSIAVPDEDWVSPYVSVKFILDEDETKQLYEYICHVINNEH